MIELMTTHIHPSGVFAWRVEEAKLQWYRTHGERLSNVLLAERAQIHPVTIARLNGRKLLDITVLAGLCQALRCAPADLLWPVPAYTIQHAPLPHTHDWEITSDAFGQTIHALLDARGMTITALAAQSDAARMTLQQWTLGHAHRFDLGILWRVAATLEVSLNRFFVPVSPGDA